MKRFLVVVVGAALLACTSIESAVVAGNEIVTSEGEAVAVIQANSIGWTFLWHMVTLIESDLNQVVNKMLVAEAKSMGANKIDLKGAGTSPRGGIFGLPALIMGIPGSSAVGVAVK
jgi:hypothetical protein